MSSTVWESHLRTLPTYLLGSNRADERQAVSGGVTTTHLTGCPGHAGSSLLSLFGGLQAHGVSHIAINWELGMPCDGAARALGGLIILAACEKR